MVESNSQNLNQQIIYYHHPSASGRSIEDKEDNDKKRKKLSGDERLTRNRERNKVHARRTRERKKNQSNALQNRINELHEEGNKLRQIIDERYTASSLLGLSYGGKMDLDHQFVPSSSICNDIYATLLEENGWIRDGSIGLTSPAQTAEMQAAKRVRRSGKYSPQEREKIRRERNRMHAKKTRDRKKQFLELSEKIISEMESEASKLRSYLLSINLITKEECAVFQEREEQSKQQIASLRANAAELEEDNESSTSEVEEEEEEEKDPDPCQEDRSNSGSDENEKWSSSDGTSYPESSLTGSSASKKQTSNSEDNLATLAYHKANIEVNHDAEQEGETEEGSRDKQSVSEQTHLSSGGDERDRDSPADYCDEDQRQNYPEPEAHESYHHGIKLKLTEEKPVLHSR